MLKRVLLVAGGVAVALIALLVILAECQKAARGPEQTFALYNSATRRVSVTFHERKADGSYGGWAENILLAPGELRYQAKVRGTYRIIVWDGDVEAEESKPLRKLDGVEVVLADGKDQYRPLYLDTTGETTFYVVDATFLYSGSGLSDAIARAAGAHRDRPYLKARRTGERLFSLPYDQVVAPPDKLPAQVAAGAVVYALVPVPSAVTDPDAIWEAIARSLQSRLP